MTRYIDLLKAREDLWNTPSHRIRDNRVRDEMFVLTALDNKQTGARLVKQLGIAVSDPSVHIDARHALYGAPREPFVLKVLEGTMSSGVRLLHPTSGGWRCSMTGKSYATAEDIAADLPVAPMLMESLATDGQGYDPACDYKVYATKAGCPILLQKYGPKNLPKHQHSFEYYDRAGNALGPIRSKSQSGKVKLTKPDNLDAAFVAAERIMKHVAVSFIRIDGYLTENGFVFGEFTPSPTAARHGFREPYSTLLGDAWAESLDMMGLRYTVPLSSSVGRWMHEASRWPLARRILPGS